MQPFDGTEAAKYSLSFCVVMLIAFIAMTSENQLASAPLLGLLWALADGRD